MAAGVKNILIYQGPGTSIRSVEALCVLFQSLYKDKLAVLKIDSEIILKTDWEEQTALLIIPGGRSLKYYEALGEAGNARIRQYVVKGGIYLGVCAGAYYAADATYFDISGKNELVLHTEQLKLLKGIEAVGPAYPGGYDYEGSTTLRAADINILPLDKKMALYFNGGCSFKNLNAETAVLADYAELDHLPALIKAPYGKGFVILSGVHFEFDAETLNLDIANATAAEKDRLTAEQVKLRKDEKARSSLMPFMVQVCLPTLAHVHNDFEISSSS